MPPDEVAVWRVPAGAPAEAWRPWMTGEEWAALGRFRFEADARREAASRGARRRLLGEAMGRPPLSLRFVVGEHGKPSLAEAAGPQFSASHSGEWVLIALAGAGRIGVDVEAWRPIERDEIASRFFGDEETPRDERGFFERWTQKEAYVKALGRGLSKPLASFRVGAGADGEPALLSCEDERDVAARWKLWRLPMPVKYSAALAAEAPLRHYRCRDFRIPS